MKNHRIGGGGMGFKNMSVPHSIPVYSQIWKTTEVREQVYQIDQVRTQHAALRVSLKLCNGLFLLMSHVKL